MQGQSYVRLLFQLLLQVFDQRVFNLQDLQHLLRLPLELKPLLLQTNVHQVLQRRLFLLQDFLDVGKILLSVRLLELHALHLFQLYFELRILFFDPGFLVKLLVFQLDSQVEIFYFRLQAFNVAFQLLDFFLWRGLEEGRLEVLFDESRLVPVCQLHVESLIEVVPFYLESVFHEATGLLLGDRCVYSEAQLHFDAGFGT